MPALLLMPTIFCNRSQIVRKLFSVVLENLKS